MGRKKKEKEVEKVEKVEKVEEIEEDVEEAEEQADLYTRRLRKKYRTLKRPSERAVLLNAKNNPESHWCDVFKKCRGAWGEWTLPFDKKKIKNMGRCKTCLTLEQDARTIKWLYQYDEKGWKELNSPKVKRKGRKKDEDEEEED